ncbi:MAG: serine/threonine-protein kinase, partial [Sorangiineae bacterium]|nr:serine/threonine-protein kinase [Sorangiineae bacterium]
MSIALETGAMLGRYELLTQIGRGGMASVWVARERSPTGRARLVAVKVLLPSLARRADFRTMFLDEGQIIRSIDHDNVVGVYEVAEDHGLLFMAMEWVEGDSLRNVIKEAQRRRPIPPEMAVRIIADTAAGLHAAHELRGWDGALRNLVHCDVSPHNILIGLSGMTKLTDFGVASAEEHFGELSSERRVKGKVGYMSPEQAGGQPIDRRTDVYALGIVLYELTTGERLFKGMNHDHSLALVMNARVPRPSSVLADYPAPLEAIVLRALEREPSARFQTAEEMQQALERYLVAERILVPRSGVAQLLKRVVGGRIEERRQAIRAALAQVDGQTPLGLVPDTAVALRDSLVSVTEPSSPSALAHLTPSVPRPSFTGTGESLLTSSQASTTAAASLPLERAASRRSPWRFGLGVGLGVAAGVAAVLALRGSSARGPVAVPIAGVESSARVQASQPTARPRDEGVDIGSLPIAGHDAGRTYDEAEREQLERAWKQRKRDAGVR